MKILHLVLILAVAFASVNAKAAKLAKVANEDGSEEQPEGPSEEIIEPTTTEAAASSEETTDDDGADPTEGPTEGPTDPEDPPEAGKPCDPHRCRTHGSCQSYLRCERETNTWVEEHCGEEMFWNPDNGSVHGGNCDLHDNISDDVMEGYRKDPECLACFWKGNGECDAGYQYQAPGNRHRNVLDLTCSAGLVFSEGKQTCQRCEDVNRSDGSDCCAKA